MNLAQDEHSATDHILIGSLVHDVIGGVTARVPEGRRVAAALAVAVLCIYKGLAKANPRSLMAKQWRPVSTLTPSVPHLRRRRMRRRALKTCRHSRCTTQGKRKPLCAEGVSWSHYQKYIAPDNASLGCNAVDVYLRRLIDVLPLESRCHIFSTSLFIKLTCQHDPNAPKAAPKKAVQGAAYLLLHHCSATGVWVL